MKKRIFLSNLLKDAHRFMKIAGVSLSEALKRAWALARLTKKMQSGIVKFYYQKVDGSVREAYGTLEEGLLPETKGSEKKSDTVQTYFDTEKQEWRCFKKLNLVF